LLSYGADYVNIYRHAATYVDRILRGDRMGSSATIDAIQGLMAAKGGTVFVLRLA